MTSGAALGSSGGYCCCGRAVDIVSVVEFDRTGEFLAAGDRGGRVVVFERVQSEEAPCEYRFYAEFQSHEPEFDYLKSLEIEEKINKIVFCRSPMQRSSLLLLTTNDKTIKLWRVFDKGVMGGTRSSSLYVGSSGSSSSSSSDAGSSQLVLPRVGHREVQKTASTRRVFSNAHAYHINSLSLNSDAETFISSDDLRINMWNLEVSDRCFNIVDIKPANMEELAEVITSSLFHPTHCHEFMYSCSNGVVKLADMRQAALCDNHAKVFSAVEDQTTKSFFSELVVSISDIKFTPDGRYILARDYLTVKVWDTHMEREPMAVIPLHEYLRPKLCDLYEKDCLFDRYEVSPSPNGRAFSTATYHNYFLIYDILPTGAPLTEPVPSLRIKLGGNKRKTEDQIDVNAISFTKKPLHVAWHPRDDVIAIGASNNLYLYASHWSNADHTP